MRAEGRKSKGIEEVRPPHPRGTTLERVSHDITEFKKAGEEIRRHINHLEILNGIATAVSKSLQLQEVLDTALEKTGTLLNVAGGLIYLFDEGSQSFVPAAYRGISEARAREVTGFKMGEGLSGYVAQSGNPSVVSDLATDSRNISPIAVKEGWHSYAGIPIKSRDRVLGVMVLVSHRKGHFGIEDVNLLRSIGNHIGIAIEHAQLYKGIQQELAERKRAEETLRIKDSAIAMSINGIAITDLEGNLTYVNDAFLKLWGYNNTDEVLGKPAEQFWRIEQDSEAVAEALRSRAGWTDELLVQRKDGSLFAVQLSANMVLDEAGKPICVMNSFIDISEQRRAERAVKKLNECFLSLGTDALGNIQKLVEAAGEILGGACVLYNRLEGELLCTWGIWHKPEGYNPKDNPEGHICYDVIKENREEPLVIESLSGTKYEKTDPNVRKYGLKSYLGYPVRLREKVVGSFCQVSIEQKTFTEKDHKIMGILAKAIAIEEDRKRAEEKIKAEKEFSEKLISTANAIIVGLDSEHRIQLFSEGAERITGYKAEEVMGKDWFEIFFKKEMYPGMIKVWKDAWGKDLYSYTNPIHSKTGKEIIAQWSNTSILNEKKKPILLLCIAVDITDREKAEKAALGYQEQLKSLTSELLLAEEKQRRSLAALVHDNIGQELAMAKLTLQSLIESASGRAAKGDERDSEVLANMPASLSNVCASIDQIIEHTHLLTFELGNPTLYVLGFEVAVEQWLAEQFHKRYGIKYKLDADTELLQLDDEISTILFRAVRELLVNVVKHAKAKSIAVRIRKVGDEAQVAVEDDGIGFSPARLQSLLSEGKMGGFGLFSIRKQLEYLGGNVEIKSALEKGTCVVLTAPLKWKGTARNVRRY